MSQKKRYSYSVSRSVEAINDFDRGLVPFSNPQSPRNIVTWSNEHADLCIETAGDRMQAVTRLIGKQKLRASKNLNTPRHI